MKTNKKTIALYAFVFIIIFSITTMLPIYLRSKKDSEPQSESQLNSDTSFTESENVQTDVNTEKKESPTQELFTGLENIRSLPLNDSNIRTFQKKLQIFLKKKSITEYTNINCIRIFDADIQKLEVIFYAVINDDADTLVKVRYSYEKDKFTFKLEDRSLDEILEELKNKFETPDTEIGNRPPDMKG